MPDSRKRQEPSRPPSDRQRLAKMVLSTWATAAKDKPPAVRMRLAEAALELWAAAIGDSNLKCTIDSPDDSEAA